MKRINTLLATLLLALAGPVMLAGPAQAGVSCHKISAKGEGQDLGGGITEARIFGGGLLNGTTDAQFDITGGEFPVFEFSGTIKFTTNKATLTVGIDGIFDVASGEFLASGPVIDATGKLEGAGGLLVFDGVQDFGDGTFIETVTGRICVDLAP